MPTLILRPAHLAAVLAHAVQGAPYEVCGLIGGHVNGGTYRAQLVVRVPNVAPTPRTHFAMSRRAMVKTIINFQRTGLQVVGIYHSHPNGAPTPSALDIAEAYWPDAVYVIVGFVDSGQPCAQAWTIRGGSAEPAALIIVESVTEIS